MLGCLRPRILLYFHPLRAKSQTFGFIKIHQPRPPPTPAHAPPLPTQVKPKAAANGAGKKAAKKESSDESSDDSDDDSSSEEEVRRPMMVHACTTSIVYIRMKYAVERLCGE